MPVDTCLGILYVDKFLDNSRDDSHMFIAGEHNTSKKYFAWLYDRRYLHDKPHEDTWLYAPVTDEQIMEFFNDVRGLKGMILQPVGGCLYSVTMHENKVVSVNAVTAEQVEAEEHLNVDEVYFSDINPELFAARQPAPGTKKVLPDITFNVEPKNIPKGTWLGVLSVIEVLDYYDRVRMFIATSDSGYVYLAYLADSSLSQDVWLYTEMNQDRIAALKTGVRSIRDVILDPVQGMIYQITLKVKQDDTSPITFCKGLRPLDVDPLNLPDKNCYMNPKHTPRSWLGPAVEQPKAPVPKMKPISNRFSAMRKAKPKRHKGTVPVTPITEVTRALVAYQRLKDMLEDGIDCPFCQFNEIHEEHRVTMHEDNCPMALNWT